MPREELLDCKRDSGMADEYVNMVQDMYKDSETVMRCAVGVTDGFKLELL